MTGNINGCENYNPGEIVWGRKGLKHPVDLNITLRVKFFNPTESTTRLLGQCMDVKKILTNLMTSFEKEDMAGKMNYWKN